MTEHTPKHDRRHEAATRGPRSELETLRSIVGRVARGQVRLHTTRRDTLMFFSDEGYGLTSQDIRAIETALIATRANGSSGGDR